MPLGQIHTDSHVHTQIHMYTSIPVFMDKSNIKKPSMYMLAKGWLAPGLTKTAKGCFCLAYLFVLCFIY